VKAVHTLMIMVPAAMLVVAHGAQAGNYYAHAHVVQSTPVYETVERAVPRQVCYEERVTSPGHGAGYSVTGPIVGAIIGGAIGNAVGHGKSNKRVGSVVGAVLGGSIGADISRRNRVRYDAGYHTENVCRVVEEYVNERIITGYDVTYEYAGETYSSRMDRDPGRQLRVRVNVTPV